MARMVTLPMVLWTQCQTLKLDFRINVKSKYSLNLNDFILKLKVWDSVIYLFIYLNVIERNGGTNVFRKVIIVLVTMT